MDTPKNSTLPEFQAVRFSCPYPWEVVAYSPSPFQCHPIKTNGDKCTSGDKFRQVGTSGDKFRQVGTSGDKFRQVGTKWRQMEASGDRWADKWTNKMHRTTPKNIVYIFIYHTVNIYTPEHKIPQQPSLKIDDVCSKVFRSRTSQRQSSSSLLTTF